MAQSVQAAGRRDGQAILAHFLRLLKLYQMQHTATVESAAPLDRDLQASTEAGLMQLYGPGIVTAFNHQPSLIGGMRIRIGSNVYDGSVRAGLAALEKSF